MGTKSGNFIKVIILLITYFTTVLAQPVKATPEDTLYAENLLMRSAFIKSSCNRYIMTVKSDGSYKSIKLLERIVSVDGEKLVVVQKLIEPGHINTDSVLVNRQTLAPLESYSVIGTGKDKFFYQDKRVHGSVTPGQAGLNQRAIITDTSFRKTMFNGLIYAETLRAMHYEKNKSFYIAEYVPGHQIKYSKLEYLQDETLIFAGKKISAKVIKVESAKRTIYYWLDKDDQELIKIDLKFANFEYNLLKVI